MDNRFKKGVIIQLEENSTDKYIIVGNMEIENKVYLLLTEFEGEIENNTVKEFNIDYSKMFVVCYNLNNNEINYDSNEEIVRKLIRKSLNA